MSPLLRRYEELSVVTISWPEAAFWCALSWTVLVARLFSRRMRLGAWRHLQFEDFLAVLVLVLATALMVLLDKVMIWYAVTTTDPNWTPARLYRHRVGAHLMVAGEQVSIATIWVNKAAMLLMYHRLTQLTSQRKQVLITACITAVAFITMELLFFVGWCRPFRDYFGFMPPNLQCIVYRNHYITSVTLNVFTDILILLIPLPILFGRSREFEIKHSWRIKIIIGIIILLGCYGIGAAIASKVYFLNNLDSVKVFDWNIREAFTCTLCANLPRTYPVIEFMARFISRTSHSALSRSQGPSSRGTHGVTSDVTALTVREMDWREADSQKGIVVSTDIEMVDEVVGGGRRKERKASEASEGGWERLGDGDREAHAR